MPKITWINILHFYQPPTADNETVVQAVEKSYQRIIGALKRNPEIKFTLNLTGCLMEKLDRLGYHGLLNDLKDLLNRGQIELTGTAAFHPLLPLLPEEEIKNNLKANQKILKKYFGENFSPPGFFSPELAYDGKLMKIIKAYGYRWVIMDEISALGKLNKINHHNLYRDKNTGLKICFRGRKLSKSYVPKNIFELISKKLPGLAITATDAELYGLRHGDQTATFEKLLKRPEIKTLTVSEFLNSLKEEKELKPLAASWESTEAELKKNLPFKLWCNEKNPIQKTLWQLAGLAISAVKEHRRDANQTWARNHLDRGLSSCTFWWASARDFKLFGAVSWNPDEIEKGATELIKSVRTLADPKTRPVKIAAEKLYLKIKRLIWHKHWRYYWEK